MDILAVSALIDLFVIGYGIYGFYVLYQMKVKGEVSQKSFLIPSDVGIDGCKDLEGFKGYMAPRLILFSALLVIFGSLSLINELLSLLPPAVSLIGSVVVFGLLIWFAFTIKRAQKKFW